jgi:uncharacterized hydantoinase/oxoprolinase family protein
MEQARRLKQIARERQANSVRMGINAISDNMKLTLSYITDMEWSNEIEKFCGRSLSKSLIRHLCQDTEVVAAKLVPEMDVKMFKKLLLSSSKNNKKNLLSEMLAIRISSGLDFQVLESDPDSIPIFKRICPVTFSKRDY